MSRCFGGTLTTSHSGVRSPPRVGVGNGRAALERRKVTGERSTTCHPRAVTSTARPVVSPRSSTAVPLWSATRKGRCVFGCSVANPSSAVHASSSGARPGVVPRSARATAASRFFAVPGSSATLGPLCSTIKARSSAERPSAKRSSAISTSRSRKLRFPVVVASCAVLSLMRHHQRWRGRSWPTSVPPQRPRGW